MFVADDKVNCVLLLFMVIVPPTYQKRYNKLSKAGNIGLPQKDKYLRLRTQRRPDLLLAYFTLLYYEMGYCTNFINFVGSALKHFLFATKEGLRFDYNISKY